MERCEVCDAPLEGDADCARCRAEWEAVNTAEYFAAVEDRGLTDGPHVDQARAILASSDRFGQPVVNWAVRTIARAEAADEK